MKKTENRKLWDKIKSKGVVAGIDKERYTPIKGLEGPFRTKSGKVVYYDPKEGKYYDRDSDMYVDGSVMESAILSTIKDVVKKKIKGGHGLDEVTDRMQPYHQGVDHGKKRKKENPHKPGTVTHAQYEMGHKKGLNEFAEGLDEAHYGDEPDSVEAVSQAVLHRIKVRHLDLIKKYGPGEVLDAVDEIASGFQGEKLDEIGSSDVSIWVNQVKEILNHNFRNKHKSPPSGLREDTIDESYDMESAEHKKLVASWHKHAHAGDSATDAAHSAAANHYGTETPSKEQIQRAKHAINKHIQHNSPFKPKPKLTEASKPGHNARVLNKNISKMLNVLKDKESKKPEVIKEEDTDAGGGLHPAWVAGYAHGRKWKKGKLGSKNPSFENPNEAGSDEHRRYEAGHTEGRRVSAKHGIKH